MCHNQVALTFNYICSIFHCSIIQRTRGDTDESRQYTMSVTRERVALHACQEPWSGYGDASSETPHQTDLRGQAPKESTRPQQWQGRSTLVRRFAWTRRRQAHLRPNSGWQHLQHSAASYPPGHPGHQVTDLSVSGGGVVVVPPHYYNISFLV